MKGNERIEEMIAESMIEVVSVYFPIVNFIEQVEYEKFCLLMDCLTCDDCSQKKKGFCSGKELEGMDEIILKCLFPGIVDENIKRIANGN